MAALKLRRERDGSSLQLGRALYTGGEGTIYTVGDDETLVAKIYQRPTSEHVTKLHAMIASPPSDPAHTQDHVSFAWPIDGVLDEQGAYRGFVMPYIAPSRSAPLFKVVNPKARRSVAQGITWAFLLRSASNLASVVGALHERDYVIGDLNESNVLLSNAALVTLVDCDSIQVPRARGGTFHCTVAQAEYAPAELRGIDLARIDRQSSQDAFSLAVLIFQLLMEGIHPFAGGWTGPGESPSLDVRIQYGDWPYEAANFSRPGPRALPLDLLPVPIQDLMKTCFVTGHRFPERRPTAAQWHDALQHAEQMLATCAANQQHRYSQHLHGCPWCHRAAIGLPDPFPALQIEQSPTTTPLTLGRGKTTSIATSPALGRGPASALTLALAGPRRGGKTTTAVNLGACLADAGWKTLIVDLSPDAEATTGLGVDSRRVVESVCKVLVNDSVSIHNAIRRNVRPNLSVLPNTVETYAADIELVYLERHEYRLRSALESVKNDYDFILIDCPCYEGSPLYPVALTAADGVILPLRTEYYGREGIQHLLNLIRFVRDRKLNPSIQLFGVVMTMFDPSTKLSGEVAREIQENFPHETFNTLIPRNVRLAEAPSYGQTILDMEARSPGALAYRQLAEEVIARAAAGILAR
jgi:cellulose biosynthesis protein BcsQ